MEASLLWKSFAGTFLKAITIHALKWDIEQGPLESSWYSLLFHGCEGIFVRLGSNEGIPEFLNLSDF